MMSTLQQMFVRLPNVRAVFAAAGYTRTVSNAASGATGDQSQDTIAPHLHPDSGKLKERDWEIRTAKFIKSSTALDHMPPEVGPEFAFIGHSNVGKSSLINMLVRSNVLAKVSKQPGKTRCINHFLINNKFYFVDCPGYGYARVSKQERLQWHEQTKEYFTKRRTLAQVFLLVDACQPPHPLDTDAAMWLAEKRVPHTLVFTKVDAAHVDAAAKAGMPPPAANVDAFLRAASVIHSALPKQRSKTIKDVSAAGSKTDGPWFVATSSVTGLGRPELLAHIAELKNTFSMPVIFR